MRQRALVHVAGPVGVGKTTFVERLLGAESAFAICVRGERDVKLRKDQESEPKTHAELRRYRAAGACAVALYRFAAPSIDAFFVSRAMEEYSEAVFIEGDCPIDCIDLTVFIAPPPPHGHSLLRREVRDRATAYWAAIDRIAQAVESPEAMVRLLGAGLDEQIVTMALRQKEVLEKVRRSMKAELSKIRGKRPPAPTEHWALEEGYAGVERAQLVVVNVRSEADRPAAERLLEDVARLRKDDAVFRDVMDWRGKKTPVTAVVADLSDGKDAGLKKALARVKRAMKQRTQ